jgi:hypothetical protein
LVEGPRVAAGVDDPEQEQQEQRQQQRELGSARRAAVAEKGAQRAHIPITGLCAEAVSVMPLVSKPSAATRPDKRRRRIRHRGADDHPRSVARVAGVQPAGGGDIVAVTGDMAVEPAGDRGRARGDLAVRVTSWMLVSAVPVSAAGSRGVLRRRPGIDRKRQPPGVARAVAHALDHLVLVPQEVAAFEGDEEQHHRNGSISAISAAAAPRRSRRKERSRPSSHQVRRRRAVSVVGPDPLAPLRDRPMISTYSGSLLFSLTPTG